MIESIDLLLVKFSIGGGFLLGLALGHLSIIAYHIVLLQIEGK